MHEIGDVVKSLRLQDMPATGDLSPLDPSKIVFRFSVYGIAKTDEPYHTEKRP